MKKIVAWVDRLEKKSLIEANKNNYSIYFAKSKDDFVKKIDSDTFPIIAIKKAKFLNVVTKIVRAFPHIRFYAMMRLDFKCTTVNELSFIVDEPNVSDGERSHYMASELISLFEDQYISP